MKTAIAIGFLVVSLLTSQDKLSYKQRSAVCKDVFLGTFASRRHRFIPVTSRGQQYSCKPCLHMMLLLLSGDVETNPGPTASNADSTSSSLSQNICRGCTSLSTRKAATVCSACGMRWHTTCAGLTVKEAQALSVWHCRNCRSSNATPGPAPSQHTAAQPPSPSVNSAPLELHSRLAELRDSCPVVKRIPKSVRASVADSLSSIIDKALSQPCAESWTRLLSFAFVVLRAPDTEDRSNRKSLTATIRLQIRDISEDVRHGPPSAPRKSAKTPPSHEASEDLFTRRVQGKCADGDVKAALRILASNEEFIQPSSETWSVLLQKHPPAPADEALPPAPTASDVPALAVTEEQVQAAIRTMPPGSAAGLDGMRPMHLKQLISAEATEPGRRLLKLLTNLVNLTLSGSVPDHARDSFFGATLCALRKKDGGLRPIAIGSVYRRLASRMAAHHLASVIGPELRPVQMGVGAPLGCEAAVHATRDFLTSDTSASSVVVKVDIRNAFNSVRRDSVLNAVRNRCPEIYII